MSALDRPAAELTVMDVYDIAALLGQEFERVIDKFGCECLVGVVPRVVRVLEFLEALVSRGAAGQEAEELRRELDRLQRERSDRYEQEKKHQKELEQVEDVWRGEVQDLLSQITQLQAENKRLLVSLSLKESPVTEEDLQKHQAQTSEKENQVIQKLKDLADKQRDEIRAKDHELTLRNEDVEALQLQQHRLIRINQDLLHRTGLMEAQGKTLIQQRAELEASAQAQQQEYAALQLEVRRLTKELQEKELERELVEIECPLGTRSGNSSLSAAPMTAAETILSDSVKPRSVWVECGGDPGFMAKCLECDKSLSLLSTTANRNNKGDLTREENAAAHVLVGACFNKLHAVDRNDFYIPFIANQLSQMAFSTTSFQQHRPSFEHSKSFTITVTTRLSFSLLGCPEAHSATSFVTAVDARELLNVCFYCRRSQLLQSLRMRQTNLVSPCRSCRMSCRRRTNSKPRCSCSRKSWRITRVRTWKTTSVLVTLPQIPHHS
ncbi:RILP-like protein 1 isoform X1 [Poecilia reticulata]|uniref:RILP-like protein 1 isoform X1 n=1 Tax=Poecilia reticulata TaxID=8081 RepID=UPI0004A44463|nr:PREDICTED: RILP-like protein 1 isoform X1 [Poecilia reticulata]